MEINWIIIALFSVLIFGQILLWISVAVLTKIARGLAANQDNFSPTVDQMSRHLDEVWTSQETQQKVIASHEKQEAEHGEILDLLRGMAKP